MSSRNVNDKMLMKMQTNLLVIRKIMGWKQQYLADKLDVTRQTIIRLESEKDRVTLKKTQYIAIRMLIEQEISKIQDDEEKNYKSKVMSAILGDYDNMGEDAKKNGEIAALAGGALASGMSMASIIGGAAVIGTAVVALASIFFNRNWLERLDEPEEIDDTGLGDR
ncbi:DNA-binding transcriptional regulator, XRE-family HTH domain [Butyrivibrio proteoclasticus]|uniref:DNA-binding transcriptional regulator, XRE-family HTH domain n=1 Tax=Butyrivibrio proteoclasticus TaxID=43305 RepID=A0A1I5SKY6_9FIRM|nr:helix-turn-helix domain-containing protein [Butyrivibrio proteoclasticus]SFP71405.1 DNA-binding transcriptional regulator, XRE-family HTH domain [Butyrivibrio proteoclasticus]